MFLLKFQIFFQREFVKEFQFIKADLNSNILYINNLHLNYSKRLYQY